VACQQLLKPQDQTLYQDVSLPKFQGNWIACLHFIASFVALRKEVKDYKIILETPGMIYLKF